MEIRHSYSYYIPELEDLACFYYPKFYDGIAAFV